MEEKYAIQKAVVVKMEEHILELTRNQAAVTSPESDKTSKFFKNLESQLFNLLLFSADLVGYSSPLSISLASSDGLSVSLRSTTELRNIQPLIVGNPISSSSSGGFDQNTVVYPSNASQPSLQRQQSIHDDVPLSRSNLPGSSTNVAQWKKWLFGEKVFEYDFILLNLLKKCSCNFLFVSHIHTHFIKFVSI